MQVPCRYVLCRAVLVSSSPAPPITRRFFGQRVLRITLRTLHIGSASMLLGAMSFTGSAGDWGPAVLLTGGGLILEELYRYGVAWFRWTQAWVALVKVGLFALALVLNDTTALWVALVAGGVISHAPGALRQFPVWGEPGPCALRSRDDHDD